jgi:hypothetical protein
MNWRTTWRHHARTVLARVRLRDLPATVVLWAGPSALDGTPILLVGSRIAEPSQNRKTGDMVQVSVMRQDMPPVDAWRIGADGAVCPAACSHRSRARGGRGTCYVNKARLTSTWQAARREMLAGRIGVPPFLFARARVRMGMEGDPAAVPVEVIAPVLEAAGAWTGYSAAWRTLPDAWKRYVMASCDTPADAIEAIARGWRPFASSTSPDTDAEYQAAGLTLCDAERPTAKTCAACLRCNGAGRHPSSPTPRTTARPGAYLPIHGAIGSSYRKKVSTAAPIAAAALPAAP